MMGQDLFFISLHAARLKRDAPPGMKSTNDDALHFNRKNTLIFLLISHHSGCPEITSRFWQTIKLNLKVLYLYGGHSPPYTIPSIDTVLRCYPSLGVVRPHRMDGRDGLHCVEDIAP